MKQFRIAVASRQDKLSCDTAALKAVLRSVLAEGARSADLSVALVGDEEISRVNRQFLGRDCPTDVIAFLYGFRDGHLEGEVVINAQDALRQAQQVGHGPEDELMLYAVHGALHLLGYDDAEPEQRRRMHERGLAVLASAGRTMDSRTLLEE